MENNQKAFTDMVLHLRKQNAKALDPQVECENNCLFRAPDGNKCAVGGLIKDELYYPELESMGVENPKMTEVLERSGYPDVCSGLLRDMQHVHDAEGIQDWEKQFAIVAGIWDLALPKE